MSVDIHHGDCLDVMAALAAEGVRVDSIVTDPPYHLTSIVKRFANADPDKEHFARTNPTSAYRSASAGFMGKKWDGGDVAFRPETWRLAYDVLKPGGHLIAFGGTRTYHRLACAIEDAGFEIRDMIAWLYGSGFPKSHDVSKAAGAKRTKVQRLGDQPGYQRSAGNVRPYMDDPDHAIDGPEPATDAAKEWEGWGTALKPALEPMVLARKPLSEKSVAANVLRHGCGAVNVDGCRVEGAVPRTVQGQSGNAGTIYGADQRQQREFQPHADGRWPANLVHDGSDEVMAAFGAFGKTRQGHWADKSYGFSDDRPYNDSGVYAEDTGTAARFFYSAKADSTDRLGSKHPTVKPVDLMRWLVRLVTPPGGTVLDPFAGTGTTGQACMAESFDAILIEREAEYVADIKNRVAHVSGHNTPLFAEVAP